MKETLDQRPIHPWSNRLQNLPEGKGEFYHWGPNYTVDPVIIADCDRPSVLLILRRKDLQWALPGGFIDPEDPNEEVAARRELLEETSLTLDEATPTLVYQGPVEDPRSTKEAWPETTALLWRTQGRQTIAAGDDAIDAAWAPLDQLPDDLYGSHADIIRQAIIDHGSIREQLAYFDSQSGTTPTTGGHMNYTRHIASLPTGRRVFVKRHDAETFSDIEREQHSREYLRKEHDVYRQLAPQTKVIPQVFELVDDHTLILEACDPRDGWLWRAPYEPTLRDRYIRETIAALREIETLEYNDTSTVAPSHESFEKEGWANYPANREEIMKRLRDHSSPIAHSLSEMIDHLYEADRNRTVRARTSLAHADLRQSNFAWHPTLGVRIVDWSWASPSSPGLDTTSFLIDLAKSGISIEDYMEDFDTTHARKLIGFWLGRSIQPSREGSLVREHQLASALAAFKLLS